MSITRKLSTVATVIGAIYFSQSAALAQSESKPQITNKTVKVEKGGASTNALIICQNDSTDFGCSGAPEITTYRFELLFDGDTFPTSIELKKVIVDGYRDCGVTFQGRRVNLPDCTLGSLFGDPVIGGMTRQNQEQLAGSLGDLLTPTPGPKIGCVKASHQFIKSLEDDRRASGGLGNNYFLAQGAFLKKFAGQTSAIEHGSRVDVQYDTGVPVTFTVGIDLNDLGKTLMNPRIEQGDTGPGGCPR